MGQSPSELLRQTTFAVMTTLIEVEGFAAVASGVVRDLGEHLGWQTGALWEAEGDALAVRAAWSAPQARLRAPSLASTAPVDEGPRGAAYASGLPHREDDPSGARMWLPIAPHAGPSIAVVELAAGAEVSPAAVPLGELAALCARVGRCLVRCQARERIDRELRMTQTQIARLHGSDVIGFMVTELDGAVLQANDALLRMLQRSRAELDAGTLRWPELTSAASLAASRDAVALLRETGIAPAFEKEYIRADGSLVPVLVGSALVSKEPAVTIGFVVDLTAQKQAEQRLAELNSELEARVAAGQAALRALTARHLHEREQQLAGLAREMHDVFGQELTILRVDLGWLTRRLEDRYGVLGPEVIERLAAIEVRLDGLFEAIHNIASELRPRILDDLGLVAAIESNARNLTRRTGLAIEVAMPDDLLVDRDLATTLYRIYQELMTNVLRHAHATGVEVAIHHRAGSLELRVADNGLGFAPAAVGSSSLGLLGIRERARACGGAFTIERGPAGGTVATLSVPWHAGETSS